MSALYVVIGGRHEVGVVGVFNVEADADAIVEQLGDSGGYVERVELNELTDFGHNEVDN